MSQFRNTNGSAGNRGAEFPRQLAHGLWVLGNPHFNLYLVQGRQASALIETGVSATVDTVIAQLKSLHAVPTFLVVTHPHADHTTGLAGLREAFPDARVVAGEGAAEFLSHPRAAESIVPEDKHMTDALARLGYPSDRPPVEEPPTLAESIVARDGHEMDLGGLTLRFIEVKGHAPGSINVHIPELNALIASDSLGFRFTATGFHPLFLTGFQDYLDTIDRLEALKPAILGIAHQGPRLGDEVKEDFRQARRVAEELRDRVLRHGHDAEKLAQELFNESYRDEFLLYTPKNIATCSKLLVKRAAET